MGLFIVRSAAAWCVLRQLRLVACLVCLATFDTHLAVALELIGPQGSVSFGSIVKVLPNGNIVVTDPAFGAAEGAVYLYSPRGNLISTITGTKGGDQIGSQGLVVLNNGNYLVLSPHWSNGTIANAGAATWGSAETGISGVVSPGNSVVGSAANDGVGYFAIALKNGNYVVVSSTWNNGSVSSAGAVTWGNGTTGTFGAVSAGNSLVGSAGDDQIGNYGYYYVAPLSNGNYVVSSPNWSNGAGAVTWGNGSGGTVGAVTASNSLVGTFGNGTTRGDAVGWRLITLSNGNYVVGSPSWENDVGAATWGNGNGGTVGPVSTSNSLVGGPFNLTALSNGNYVVGSPGWQIGYATVGAATWGNGNGGTVGQVSASNSLVGSTEFDDVGTYVTALSNGNYVVGSPAWNNGATTLAGAATWCDGNGGTKGIAVSASNSLVGTTKGDQVSLGGVVALSNGNYVVSSPRWRNGGVYDVGAVTWGNGSGGIVGLVSSTNSLINTLSSSVNSYGVYALRNGNYVVRSSEWGGGGPGATGAVTWGSNGGTSGTVSASNSLVGSAANDRVGDDLTVLSNGNYVIASQYWSGDIGAVTWGSGNGGTIGVVSSSNSIAGIGRDDQVGSGGVTAYSNGNYVIWSPQWKNMGAVTLRRGTDYQSDKITAQNSVLGIVAGGGSSMTYDYDVGHDQLVVGRPVENVVTIFKAEELFRNGFDH